jgi:hypothetical protein
MGSRSRGFAEYAVTAVEEWDAQDGTIALRFVRFVDGPRPHAAWLRPGDGLEHAAATPPDRSLCGLAQGEVHRHLFQDVPPERRCSPCQAQVEREAEGG